MDMVRWGHPLFTEPFFCVLPVAPMNSYCRPNVNRRFPIRTLSLSMAIGRDVTKIGVKSRLEDRAIKHLPRLSKLTKVFTIGTFDVLGGTR